MGVPRPFDEGLDQVEGRGVEIGGVERPGVDPSQMGRPIHDPDLEVGSVFLEGQSDQ